MGSTRTPSRVGWWWPILSYSARRGVAIVLVALATGGVAYGCRELWLYAQTWAREQSRFLLPFQSVRFTAPPTWIRGDIRAQSEQLLAPSGPLNTLDPQLAEQIGQAFALNPWVREVQRVRVTHAPSIEVDLIYREPVAVVRGAGVPGIVDRDGVVVPYEDVANPQAYIAVTGVTSTPQGPTGTAWGDPRVAAAAALAEFLVPHRAKLGVTAIDTSRYRGPKPPTGPLYLLTERGTRITWGRPPAADYPGELSGIKKLERLIEYVNQFGSLDAPSGPYEIDITHWGEPTRRPRAGQP